MVVVRISMPYLNSLTKIDINLLEMWIQEILSKILFELTVCELKSR